MNCSACFGSGEILGLGHIKMDCPNCDGTGKDDCSIKDVIDKDSSDYLDAKEKIKAVDVDISDKEAEEILDEELKKFKKKG